MAPSPLLPLHCVLSHPWRDFFAATTGREEFFCLCLFPSEASCEAIHNKIELKAISVIVQHFGVNSLLSRNRKPNLAAASNSIKVPLHWLPDHKPTLRCVEGITRFPGTLGSTRLKVPRKLRSARMTQIVASQCCEAIHNKIELKAISVIVQHFGVNSFFASNSLVP